MRTTRLARGPRDRALGRFLVGLAAVSAVMGVVSVVVGVLLVSTLRNSVDDSLEITSETLDTVSDSITLSSSIVDTLRVSITNVSTALTTVQDSLDTSATTIGDVGTFLGGPLSDTLDAVSVALPTLQSTAGAIDDTLGLLDRIPFGPNYSPGVPLADSVGQLAQAVGPLPEQLRALDQDFIDLQTSAAEVSARLSDVITDVDGLVERLDGIDVLLDRYEDSAEQARRLTSSSRGELDRTASLAVLFAVLVSTLFVGQPDRAAVAGPAPAARRGRLRRDPADQARVDPRRRRNARSADVGG